MKKHLPPSDSQPAPFVPRYAAKGVGRDRTNPRTHKTTAKGGPIERWNINDAKPGSIRLMSVSLVKDPLPGYEFRWVEKEGVDKSGEG